MKKKIALMVAFGCLGASAASANYDILGRKGSKMNSPMVYKNVDYSKVKKEKQEVASLLGNRSLAKKPSGITSGAKAIVGKFSPRGYYFKNCSNSATGCGEVTVHYTNSGGLDTYLDNANAHFINVSHDLSGTFYTAGASLSSLSGYNMTEVPYSFTNPVQVSPYQSNQYITYAPFTAVNALTNRNYLSASDIGVYLDEQGLPTRLNPNTDGAAPFLFVSGTPNLNEYSTMPGYEMRSSRMYKVLRNSSERSVVYVAGSRPSNPSAATPQIYMGLEAYGGGQTSSYSAANLDNYIYNNRTIEIVGAGNTGAKLSMDAFAVNAITVGALDPFTGNETSYSAKTKPKYCSNCGTYNKPEVYNYSNFYINDYHRTYTSSNHTYTYAPYYDGTESSAALTAGMVSNMLSLNEFYKWHPEVVKAVAINGQYTSSATRYSDLVFDQSDYHNTHVSLYFIGDVNSLMKVYNDCPRNSEISCAQPRKEIRLHFSKSDLFKNSDYSLAENLDGFYASIAWLNSGTDISNLHALPQTFEIEGYHRHGNPNLYQNINDNSANLDDSSLRNEHQQRTPYKSIYVAGFQDDMHPLGFTIRIVLTDEKTNSENYGQMVLGLDIKPTFRF